MRAVEALCLLLDDDRPRPLLAARKRFGVALEALDVAGVLRPGEPLGAVPCRLCEVDHEATVFRRADGRARYVCTNAGEEGEADDDALKTIRLDRPKALQRLRDAFAPMRPEISLRESMRNLLWVLGESDLGGARWTVMLARRTSERLPELLSALPAITKQPGLVLTTDLAANPVFPAGEHRVAPLATVLDVLPDGRFHADVSAIRAALGLGEPPREVRGRPPTHEAAALEAVDRLTVAQLSGGDDAIIAAVRELVPGLRTTNKGMLAKGLRVQVLERAKARLASERLAP